MDKATLNNLLQTRAYLYQVFHSLLGQEPTVELLECTNSVTTKEALGLYAEIGDSSFEESFQDFQTSLEEFTKNPTEFTDSARRCYTRLFVGPGHLPAGPWESLYDKSHFGGMLFQESTLAVRQFYRSQGFLPKGYPSVPDDSLALELDCMHHLSQRLLDASETNDNPEMAANLTAMITFLNQHLNQWVPNFVDTLNKSGEETGFYGALTALLPSFLATDEKLLEEIEETLS